MNDFLLDEVVVTDPIFSKAREADLSFIRKLNPDRLLSAFRRSAGLDDLGVEPYGGWEDSRIGGHTMGHYLAACAQEIASSGDKELTDRVTYIVEELGKCQKKHGNGFLFGAKLEEGELPERQFDIEEGRISVEGDMVTWVPWYTLHKIFDGLLVVHRLCHMEKALDIAKRLGDWVVERIKGWTPAMHEEVLKKEYGGMNDCLYDLYHQSGEEKYEWAATFFDDTKSMEKMTGEGQMTLYGIHANTTIPKFLGGMEKHPELADKFWDKVVHHHAYATGGISDMEHFWEGDSLDERRTQCNCEGCCAHNMLKLSHRLYHRRTKAKYLEYAERLLFNAILGAIDNEEGTTAYFSPMATGYQKTFSKKNPEENMFWCCTGTGMENYTKLQETIYAKEGNTLWVNQYIGSIVKVDDGAFSLEMDWMSDVQGKWNYRGDEKEREIRFRIPSWCEGEPKVTGEGKEIFSQDGYVVVKGFWQSGDCISMSFDVRVKAEYLEKKSTAVSFSYGPFVLAAQLGCAHADEKTGAGIDVVADAWKVVGKEEAKLAIEYGKTNTRILPTEKLIRTTPGESAEEYLKNIQRHMERVSKDSLRFELTGIDSEKMLGCSLTFVPYYEIVNERYGIYWYC